MSSEQDHRIKLLEARLANAESMIDRLMEIVEDTLAPDQCKRLYEARLQWYGVQAELNFSPTFGTFKDINGKEV